MATSISRTHFGDYIDAYIEAHGAPLIWWEFTLGNTPTHLTANDIVKRMRIRDMIAISSAGDLFSFIDEFVEEGGNINVLAQRILDEAGYRTDIQSVDTFVSLVELGATNIDIGEITEAILGNDNAARWVEYELGRLMRIHNRR